MTDTQDHLLWIDLETTGSDVDKDCIIEIGAILTTTDLEVLGEWQCVVRPSAEGLGRLVQSPVVREMHERNDLLRTLFDGGNFVWSQHAATKGLLKWLGDLGAKEGRTVLAGSGVGHFDRRFIARYMPQLDRFLRYWCIDIGVVRRAHEMWVGTEVSTANDGKTHRALDDIRCHLDEARAFKALWASHAAVTA